MPARAGSVWRCPLPGNEEIVVLSLGYAPDHNDQMTVCLTIVNTSSVFYDDPAEGDLDSWPLDYVGPSNVWRRIA